METLQVRVAVFQRQRGLCNWCGEQLSWANFQLHEKVFRSRGGKVDLENSVGLCSKCHLTNPYQKGAHGDRRPRFKKKMLDKSNTNVVE